MYRERGTGTHSVRNAFPGSRPEPDPDVFAGGCRGGAPGVGCMGEKEHAATTLRERIGLTHDGEVPAVVADHDAYAGRPAVAAGKR